MITSFFAALLLSVIVSGLSTRMRSEVGKMNVKYDARIQVNSSDAVHAPQRSQRVRLEQRRMEGVMVEILLIGVLVVLAFLCLAGPGGETGSRHRR
jgi:hypothetical protein